MRSWSPASSCSSAETRKAGLHFCITAATSGSSAAIASLAACSGTFSKIFRFFLREVC